MSRRRIALYFVCLIGFAATSSLPLFAWQFAEPVPQWIWSPSHNAGHVPPTSCHFRRTILVEAKMRSASIAVAADDAFELYLNGKHVGEGTNDQGIISFDVGKLLRQGENVVAVRVTNRNGSTAGLALRFVIVQPNQQERTIVTDGNWRTSLSPLPLWNRNSYSDHRWSPARSIGPFSNFVARQKSDQAFQERVAKQGQDRQQAAASADEDTPSPSAADLPLEKGSIRSIVKLPQAGGNLEVPREFELQQIAGHRDVGSLLAMTFNEFGHLIAAQENGSLLLIYDKDKDGQFDTIRDYADSVKNCQGILAMNGSVLVVGTGPQGSGLYRLSDSKRDGFLDETKLLLGFSGKNIEHGPHGLVLGSDGLIYGVVGNHAQLSHKVDVGSPYQHSYEGDLVQPKMEDPGGHAAGVKAPGGTVFRTDVNGDKVEIVAGGLRNAYDLAVNSAGEIFTHDSDMESDLGTTWFRPTRVYHVIPGAEFGWRSGWSKWPDSHIDGLVGIADTGRGSPTGMTIYEHVAFPKDYRNVMFSCDWSEGKIVSMRLREDGASYRAVPKTFISGEPLNVTDIEVGPDGALYFITGGRGTAGNIYRVAWKGHVFNEAGLGTGIDRALRQPQINSSWARQRVAKIQEELGDNWSSNLIQAVTDTNRPFAERVQAMRIMQWLGPAPSLETLLTLSRDTQTPVRRQATYALGLASEAQAAERLTELLEDRDAVVRRRACEAMVRIGILPNFDRMKQLLSSRDRAETWAARRMLERMPRRAWETEILTTDDQSLFLNGATAILIADPDPQIAKAILDRSLKLMDGFISDQNFIDLLRVQQLALMRGKLQRSDVPLLSQRLAEEYPSSSHAINRELIRLLTYLQVESIVDRYLAELKNEMPVADRLHLAIHLTRIQAGWTTEQKLAVFQYLEAPPETGNSLPGYLQNVARDFGNSLSDEELQAVLAQGDRWPGASLAALFRLPDQLSAEQLEQIKQLDAKIANADGETTNRLKVGLVAVLARDGSSNAFAYLREMYDRDPARRVEIALGLAEKPKGDNWEVLVRSLPLLDNPSVRHILTKLREQSQSPQDAEPYRQVILAAERLGDDGAQDAIGLLERWQGFAPSNGKIPAQQAVLAWKKWFTENYPNEPLPELTTTQGGKWDYESLLSYLKRSEREGKASVERGKTVFTKAQCSNCHRFDSDGEAMGPDLTTISKRFLTQEILDSILYPSKVISDQYAAKVLLTTDGKAYTGIVAPTGDGEVVILQANGQKVRIPEDEIDESEPSRVSAMPEGLLDQLTLAEITDLFAYLGSGRARVSQQVSPNIQR